MKILDDKLTNKSIATLQFIMDAACLNEEMNDIIIACGQAKLTGLATHEGSVERFGYRSKKNTNLSFLFQIINGLASENERLKNEIAELKK